MPNSTKPNPQLPVGTQKNDTNNSSSVDLPVSSISPVSPSPTSASFLSSNLGDSDLSTSLSPANNQPITGPVNFPSTTDEQTVSPIPPNSPSTNSELDSKLNSQFSSPPLSTNQKSDNFSSPSLPPTPPPTNVLPTPPLPVSQPTSPPPKNKKGFIIFLILFFLFLVIGLVTFYFYKSNLLSRLESNYDNNKPTLEQTAIPDTISPTPIPINIPTSIVSNQWLTRTNDDCGFSISYPPKWTSQSNCIKDQPSSDCLKSENFSGTSLSTGSIVEQGMIITIQCQPTSKTISNTNDILTSCQQQNLDSSNTCQQLDTVNQQFIIVKAGEYQTVAGNYQYAIKVEPAPPTTFGLLKQILATFQPKTPSLKEKTTTEILPNLDSVIEDRSSSAVPN